jgi:hypothetical protein
LGSPFFAVSKTVTDGLAATLMDEIVPELLQMVPGQPSEAELAAQPLLHRFVVNPAWRTLDKSVSDKRRELRDLRAEIGALSIDGESQSIQVSAERVHDLQQLDADLKALREQRRTTPRKVRIDSLPENERPQQLLPLTKMLTDTVKMIAYRAETALVGMLRPYLAKEEEARALIRELFVSAADLEPDEEAKTLTVRIHRMACPAHDKAADALLKQLTEESFIHPETGMRMIFTLV